ncbi:hypothetical protein [Catellicoccus marimammalium]|uniref:Uncharacterized protein n=1 Tax=Catellicoccus marimammalium M35/04/3 TaxID=1234409 RepID=K8Z7Z0_9ENTE|nr:hypothetical protein [Catellicoccus marimammalium]EKU27099.1 hypothetical protein C683_1095 [Catellicoccus marimammalium M35/04/3]
MKQMHIGVYFQNINDLITNTEEVGSKMHPYYEEIRTALDENKEISVETLAKVHTIFEEGVEQYQEYCKQVDSWKVPVKLMGLHTKLAKAYHHYVDACEAMLNSVNPDEGLNKEAFNQSEQEQDQYSQEVSAIVARMANQFMR